MNGSFDHLKRSRPSESLESSYDPLNFRPRRVRLLTEKCFKERNELFRPEDAPVPNHYQKPSAVKIQSISMNFDVHSVLNSFNKQEEEKKAVEQNLSKEKNLLREAYILRQRRKMQIEN